jgi:hypothetical protein
MNYLRTKLAILICALLLLSCSKSESVLTHRQVKVDIPVGLKDKSLNNQPWSLTVSAADSVQYQLHYSNDQGNHGSISMMYKGKQVYENSDRSISLEAICYEANKQKPAILYTGVMEGIGVDFLNMVIMDAPDSIEKTQNPSRFDDGLSSYSLELDYKLIIDPDAPQEYREYEALILPLKCEGSQISQLSLMSSGKTIDLCTCDIGTLLDDVNANREGQLRAFLPEEAEEEFTPELSVFPGKKVTFSQKLVPIQGDFHAFEALLKDMQQSGNGFQIEWFKNQSGDLVNITTVNRPLYANSAFTFVRGKDNKWFLLQYLTDSSKGFNIIESVKVDDDKFMLNMCVESCDWWGIYRQVDVDTIQTAISLLPGK